MPRNLKRGFNRLFIVLTVLWVVFCTVVFPFNERRKASAQYDKDSVSCYSNELGNGEAALHTCLQYVEENYKNTVHLYSIKNLFIGAWRLVLGAILLPPLVVYGIVRGIAATSMWVWRGYDAKQ